MAPFIQNHIELCINLESPRLIKSHLPANLLPLQIWEKKQKVNEFVLNFVINFIHI